MARIRLHVCAVLAASLCGVSYAYAATCTTNAECADATVCTIDVCDSVSGCSHIPNDSICNDSLFCNGTEVCDVVLDCQAGTAPGVSDGLSCTIDTCNEITDQLVHTPLPGCEEVPCTSDADCDDSLFCNGRETCGTGENCEAGKPPKLSDGLVCTIDSCDEDLDQVVHTPKDASCNPPGGCTSDSECNDGLFCNGAEFCDPVLGCQAGAAPNLDDGDGCTIDTCNEITDQVVHNALEDCGDGARGGETCGDSQCDDGLFCNGVEVCDAVLGCQPGAAPVVDDGLACTIDSCNELMDKIVHARVDATCVELTCTNDSQCNDGLFCNGEEVCGVAGNCEPGTPPLLADGDACTIDGCDEALDQATHTPDIACYCTSDSQCDDTLFCNGVEFCDAVLGCRPGTEIDLDDGDICTIDTCNEIFDVVIHDALEGCGGDVGGLATCTGASECDDTLFCNGVEVCDTVLGCQPGTAPNSDDGLGCTIDTCDEIADRVVHSTLPGCEEILCTTDADCDDTLFCNGLETCGTGGNCEPAAPPEIRDGVACTIDSCDEDLDQVVHTPKDANCDPTGGCPNDSYCDDSLFCNGAEICDAVLGCQAGTPPNVDDGEECTVDFCNEIDNEVMHLSKSCGDGFLDPVCAEECDDGNSSGGDGCSSACLNESVVTWLADGAVAVTECGQEVPQGKTGRLVGDLDCTLWGGNGVKLLKRATLDLNGFSLIGDPAATIYLGGPKGINCRSSRCTVIGPGVISGFSVGIDVRGNLSAKNIEVTGASRLGIVVRGNARISGVIVTGSQLGIKSYERLLLRDSVISQCGSGVSANKKLRIIDSSVTDNWHTGISASKASLKRVTITGNGRVGINGRRSESNWWVPKTEARISVSRSTITGNGHRVPCESCFDIKVEGRVRVRNSTVGTIYPFVRPPY